MKKEKPRFIVEEDGQPCRYERIVGIFGTVIPDRKTRVLVKSSGDPHRFTNEIEASKAANRAVAMAAKLQGTLLDDWPKLERFVKRGNFKIVPA